MRRNGRVRDDAPPEEAMFLQRLRDPRNKHLWEVVQSQIEANHIAKKTRDQQKLSCKRASRAVFRRDIEERIWRRLGVEAGVLPGTGTDFLRISLQNLSEVLSHPHTDFLQEPWMVLQE